MIFRNIKNLFVRIPAIELLLCLGIFFGFVGALSTNIGIRIIGWMLFFFFILIAKGFEDPFPDKFWENVDYLKDIKVVDGKKYYVKSLTRILGEFGESGTITINRAYKRLYTTERIRKYFFFGSVILKKRYFFVKTDVVI